jgi:hypothetical protein
MKLSQNVSQSFKESLTTLTPSGKSFSHSTFHHSSIDLEIFIYAGIIDKNNEKKLSLKLRSFEL